MSPEQWERVKEIFGEALDRPATERRSFLESACGTDTALRAEVESLLASSPTGDLLENPWQPLKSQPLKPHSVSLYPGLLLGSRYRLEREIGQGGFGKVFLAIDQQLHSKRVVVKALLDRNAYDPWFESRFDDEIRALAMIDHPGVVGVLDSGRTPEGVLYLVMQFAEGQTLRSLLSPGSLPLDRVSRLIAQMAEALDAAHEKGIIHRDLKPENVMVQRLTGEQERVRLIDFGIARLKSESMQTNVSRVVGSPLYMAPEQLAGRASVASDIFCLGVIAYELITGKKPFEAHTTVEQYTLQSSGAFERPRMLRPDLPEEAERVLSKALSFHPQDRHASAREFSAELAAALAAFSEQTPVTESEPGEYDTFISYAGRDRDLTQQIVAALESRGAHCFLAARDLAEDAFVPAAIAAAVQRSRSFLLILTEDAGVSQQVVRELELAASATKPLVAVRVGRAEPQGIVSLLLARPKWVDCTLELTPADLDHIISAVRAQVTQFSGTGQPVKPLPPSAVEPSEPLLTEAGAALVFGKSGSRQLRLIVFFSIWAVITCLLSVFGNAGDITVMLAGPDSPKLVPVRFGFLYELNGAFFYLFVAPMFFYFAIRFIQECQSALAALASRDQLIAARPTKTSRTALALIAQANRRWMSPLLLGLTLAISTVLIVGAEYLPPKSDYKRVMFGYVQAPWIADYASQCPNCTLQELGLGLGRTVEPLGNLTVDQLDQYRIVPPYYQRSGSVFERMAFILFMTSVLGLEVSVGVFVVWTIFKVLFVLRLIYRAIVPSKPYFVEIYLRYTDPLKLFGLEPLHRALLQLVGLIGVSVVLEVLSWWTNVLKGSKRTLREDLDTLGGWGQFLVTNYSVLLALMLLIYLFFMSGKTREAATEESKKIAAMRRSGAGGGANLERLLGLIADQSIWSHPRYTIAYVVAPVVYVMSLLVFNRINMAHAVGDVWDVFLRHILGKE